MFPTCQRTRRILYNNLSNGLIIDSDAFVRRSRTAALKVDVEFL